MAKTTQRSVNSAGTKGRNKQRPVSAAIIKALLLRVAEGATLREVCKAEGMPAESTVRRLIRQSPELRSTYARAREERAERWAEELIEIADDATNDYVERKKTGGGSVTVLDDEHVRRSQLRIDTRKWLLARLMPGQFGDRIETQLSGPGGGPVQVENSISAGLLASLDRLRARLPSPSPTTIDGETDKE